MVETPYLPAVSGFSSTSTLKNLARPSYFSLTRSRTGASILQGGHQVAVKSTTTTPEAFSTEEAKESLESAGTFDIVFSKNNGAERFRSAALFDNLRTIETPRGSRRFSFIIP